MNCYRAGKASLASGGKSSPPIYQLRKIPRTRILSTVLGVITSTVLTVTPRLAEALSGEVNGFGYGTATVNIWCAPNAPPAAANFTQSQTGFVPTASLGPGLAGCNPNTSGFLSGGSLWRWNQQKVSMGGDTVDDHSLLPFVTPTSTLASGTVSVIGDPTSSSSALFTISWSGSDPGVAAHLAWYEGTTLLYELLRVGPWSETIGVSITSTGPIEDVVLRASGAAVSLVAVPAPAAIWLLGSGLVVLINAAYRKKK